MDLVGLFGLAWSERQSHRGCLLYDSRTCNRRTRGSSINSLMGNRWTFYLVSWQLPSDWLPHDFRVDAVGAVMGATCPRRERIHLAKAPQQRKNAILRPSSCLGRFAGQGMYK